MHITNGSALILFLVILFPQVSYGDVSGKYAPANGQALAIIGQDCDAIGGVEGYQGKGDSYFDGIVSRRPELLPGGFSAYAFFKQEAKQETRGWWIFRYSVTTYKRWADGFQRGGCLDRFAASNRYRNTALHLSLGIQDVNRQVAEGHFDDAIADLAHYIRRADRPVYLRIGYEFDNVGHGNPSPYWFRKAWQRIVSGLWSHGVTNFATVFASTFNERVPFVTTGFSYEEYYPGDIYVDWVGFSYWGVNPFFNPESGMMEFARRLGKPVMIAESTPMGAKLDEWGAGLMYHGWFDRYFYLINTNSDVIKAFSYISAEWSHASDLFCDPNKWYYWPFCNSNTQVDQNVLLRSQWINELSKESYLHAGPELFQDLGYR